MDAAVDTRFDPNFTAQVLLELAGAPSVEDLLNTLVTRAAERSNVICLQIWLLDKPDRSLHLAAGCGQPPHGFDNSSIRIPLGTGILGRIAATPEQIVLRDLDQDWKMLGNADWLKQQGICGFSGAPIAFKGEVLGITAIYLSDYPPNESRPWSQIFANEIGAAIANARAFEEIRRLRTQLEQQNAYLQEEVVEARAFGDLVGQSTALRQIISQIDVVAPTEASVLILGETGTGKELVAREIHRRSQRKDKPLVRVNCASIPKELFESEFFGHVKGAFTGAIKDRAGRFETAQGGTIFLDEIGEVTLEMQSKLLRVLQEKRYERVGDDRTRVADARIVAASNRDLKKEVAAGRFREDLFYRLNVFPIHVMPLRERLDDVPSLAKHFVELSAKELKAAKPRLTKAAVDKLQNYDWPGNVRELRNVIERAVILARGKALEFDLPFATQTAPPSPISRPAFAEDNGHEPAILTEAEIQRRERDNLVAALEKANWKIKGADGASELLGVKPTTLLSRMKKWGLERPAPIY
jgi:transcriptional regulator with GAF, ATPase, and Fis domain